MKRYKSNEEKEIREVANHLPISEVRQTEPLKTGIPVLPESNASTQLIHLIGKNSLHVFYLDQHSEKLIFSKQPCLSCKSGLMSERVMKLITDLANSITWDQ